MSEPAVMDAVAQPPTSGTFRKLQARLRAMLRRAGGEMISESLRVADLTVDTGTLEVRRADRLLTVTPIGSLTSATRPCGSCRKIRTSAPSNPASALAGVSIACRPKILKSEALVSIIAPVVASTSKGISVRKRRRESVSIP